MYIFIDESGNFPIVGETHGPSVSLVGALIVPERSVKDLFRRYAKVRRGLVQERGEVKGCNQDALGIARVVSLLASHDAIFEASAIDMWDHTEAELLHHKQRQAEAFTNSLTEKHIPELVQQVWELRRHLEQMSLPLYVQGQATASLMFQVIQNGTLYFSQRVPRELGAFHWVIDAKEKTKVTKTEEWWKTVMIPGLDWMSQKRPITLLDVGDYSYFERFMGQATDRQIARLNLTSRAIMNPILVMHESFRISPDPEPGLELVDIVTNATRRAFRSSLPHDGWRGIPGLMIHRHDGHYMSMVQLSRKTFHPGVRPYDEVLRRFRQGGRPMLAPRFQSGSLVNSDGHRYNLG